MALRLITSGKKAGIYLFIEPIHAESCNSVSQKVACEMAVNVNKMFVSDYGIAITGFASLAPEINVHELYAFFAIALKEKIVIIKKIEMNLKEEPDSVAAQLYYANEVINEFCNFIHTQTDAMKL